MIKLLAIITILGGGFLFGLGQYERKAIYPFDRTRVAPAQVGLPNMQEVEQRKEGNRQIIWVQAPRAGKPTLLYFHGNAGNLANRAGRFRQFVARGYGVIAPAYRGSSGSTGRPNEPRLSRDALQVYGQLDELIPGLTAKNVVIYGESLGTGVALKLVAQSKVQPRAVILEAPYTALPDVVLHLYPNLRPILNQMTNIWDSRNNVKALRAPLLVLHGTKDELIPIGQGREVFKRAGPANKTFIPVQGAGHTDIWRSDVLPVLWRFIDRT